VITFLRGEGYQQPIGDADRRALVLRGMRVRADVRRRGIGTHLLAEVAATIGSQTCYCIPYRWLISFYAQAGFLQVRPEEVPAFLARRHEKYMGDGLDVGADVSALLIT